jgi:hypothetical protein
MILCPLCNSFPSESPARLNRPPACRCERLQVGWGKELDAWVHSYQGSRTAGDQSTRVVIRREHGLTVQRWGESGETPEEWIHPDLRDSFLQEWVDECAVLSVMRS